MAFCGNCGTKVEDGKKFCPECGTVMEAKAPQQQPQPQHHNNGNYISKCFFHIQTLF